MFPARGGRDEILVLALVGCSGSDDGPGTPPLGEPSGCDPLVPEVCALPWPSSLFEAEDPSTASGYRLALGPATLPINRDGVQIRPDMMNRKDGYSTLGPMAVWFDGVSIDGVISHTDLAAVDAVDARTGDHRHRDPPAGPALRRARQRGRRPGRAAAVPPARGSPRAWPPLRRGAPEPGAGRRRPGEGVGRVPGPPRRHRHLRHRRRVPPVAVRRPGVPGARAAGLCPRGDAARLGLRDDLPRELARSGPRDAGRRPRTHRWGTSRT